MCSSDLALNCNAPLYEEDYEKLGTRSGACHHCHTGKCPVGVATQNPELEKRLDPEAAGRRLRNYLNALTLECQRSEERRVGKDGRWRSEAEM